GSAVGNSAERILRWLFAGRGGGELHFAGLGMARNVLGGRGACAAGVLYSVSRAGIGCMAATSRCHDRRDRARGERALENLQLSRGPDDTDDVSCTRHAGFVSGL